MNVKMMGGKIFIVKGPDKIFDLSNEFLPWFFAQDFIDRLQEIGRTDETETILLQLGVPVEEVEAAKQILQSLGIRRFSPDIISCPTCGRCQVDLVKIVRDFNNKLNTNDHRLTTRPQKVALMGCEVNGPGEAKEADIGIAFGKNAGILFKKGKIIKKVSVKDSIRELMRLL